MSSRIHPRWVAMLLLTLGVLLACRSGWALETPCAPSASVCVEDLPPTPLAPTASTASPASTAQAARLVYFFGVDCPRCAEAKPLVDALEREGIDVERVEIRADPAGRRRFQQEVSRLRLSGAGVPLFVAGDRAVVGYRAGATEAEVRAMLASRAAPETVRLRWLGEVDPRRSWLWFTVAIGLVDGINPCAMYVLIALLGILLHVRSRARILLFGGTFVVMSGLVYLLFMSVWLGFFLVAGLSRALTVVLGLALLTMGLVNLKELVWFKQGPSLMLPDRAKPGLFRRMRAIAAAPSLPVAMVGIGALAFVVNLVELGCTLGLPAIYTRLLAARGGARAPWLVLYNVLYVVPLAIIVAVFALGSHRVALTERGAKVLKAVSGALLVVFGLLFLVWPDALR